MAHFEKYKISQVGGLLNHYLRLSDKHSNNAIDTSKTALNYNFNPEPIKSMSELKKSILSECESLQGHIKSNAVAMVDLCITLPKDEMDNKAFFQACFNYCLNRFGNCISASVHMDETTPHMHYAFAPITEDKRLCCKDIVNRNMLRTFHNELEKAVSEELGHKVSILNGATKEMGGHKTIKELKNENNNLEKEIENKKIEIKDIEKKIELKNNDFQNIEEKYNKKSEELEKNLDNDRSRLAHLNVELVDTYSKKKEIEKEIAVYEDSLNTFKLKKLFLEQPIVQKMFNEFKSAVKKVNEKER